MTLTEAEVTELAQELKYGRMSHNFTNLENKRAVAKECKQLGIRTRSRTAHGSLLDPRYTVEGRMLPDRGFGNSYKQFQPKLYVLESEDRGY